MPPNSGRQCGSGRIEPPPTGVFSAMSMKKSRERGRPSLPKKQVKSITVCARTDEQTYRRCKRAAQVVGMRFTDWVRTRLHEAAEHDLAA
jgi:hypothetical protein